MAFAALRKQFLATVILAISLVACKPADISTLPAMTLEGKVYCIIEIPAGTNKKIEYNKSTRKFEVDQRDGQDRIINYLPYPGNYGFIPSTYSDPEKGGDGDALDILVICESLPTGTVIEVIPMGMLKLVDDGESDFKIIAIPSDPKFQTVSAGSFEELLQKYPTLTDMIEGWFLNYDSDPSAVEGWGDEEAAKEEIRMKMSPSVGTRAYP